MPSFERNTQPARYHKFIFKSAAEDRGEKSS